MKNVNKFVLTAIIVVVLSAITVIGYQRFLMVDVSAQTEIDEEPPIIQNNGEACGVRFSVEQKVEKERRFRGDLAARGSDAGILTGGVIQVYWTIYHYGPNPEQGNLTDQQIADSMTIANQGFAKTGWQFVLAGVERRPTTLSGFRRGGLPRRRPADQLNIVTQDLPSGLYGFSTSMPPYFGGNGDYIALDYQDVIPNPNVSYQWTHVIPHEIGHWMGLDHTFVYGCTEPEDFVDDTPATLLTYGCPVRSDTCRPTRENNPGDDPAFNNFEYGGLDPIHNFMGYNDDSCTFEFSRGQDQRMDEVFTLYRALR